MDKIREECGLFALIGQKNAPVAAITYYGLFALQHRGQESAGIVVNDQINDCFRVYKDEGIVDEIFDNEKIEYLGEGNMALGHVRYGTGQNSRTDAQPLVVNHMKGRMAIAYNGSITNARKLKEELEMKGMIFHTTSDAEIMAYAIIQERLNTDNLETAVSKAIEKFEGAFSIVIMSHNKIIAVRDMVGVRPLCYGRMSDGMYVIASETCALEAVGAKFVADVQAGEVIVFDQEGVRSDTTNCGKKPRALCVFEYVYFARPDSVVDGCSVHNARVRAGELLAKQQPVDADLVIGVPDSGIDAAIGFARESRIPYDIGLIKNKYIGRTFIDAGQKFREKRVSKSKRVVLIDDSIVRGTTIARLIKLLREGGAKEVHLRISSPPFIYPCYYGTDVKSKDGLIACQMTIEEIRKKVNADSLVYLSLENCKQMAGEDKGFCTACFDGIYPTPIPNN
jgi:amidophosphoribosyltransferase